MTPLGVVPAAGLAALRAFGDQAERLEYPHIDVGGFIVPGRDPATSHAPGMEHDGDAAGPERWEQSPREEAGPSAGPRARSTKAAPGAAPHALEQLLTPLNLDLSGLVGYHPQTRVVASSETVVHLNIPVGLLRELPLRARLTLEIPLVERQKLSRSMQVTGVPDVRTWAIWDGGAMNGTVVRSHHQNPDAAICACMPGQWIMGVNPLTDYVAYCILWVAKALHERLLGFYPGPQHCTVIQRVERDRRYEYCGCGKLKRYRDCCRAHDMSRSAYDRWREGYLGRMEYVGELTRQGRPMRPPVELLRLGLEARRSAEAETGLVGEEPLSTAADTQEETRMTAQAEHTGNGAVITTTATEIAGRAITRIEGVVSGEGDTPMTAVARLEEMGREYGADAVLDVRVISQVDAHGRTGTIRYCAYGTAVRLAPP